jgi:vacuolar-type H+-ATPase subunit H
MKETVDKILKEEALANARLEQARQDGERIVQQARKEAQAVVEQTVLESDALAQKRRDEISRQLLAEKEKALADIRSQVSGRAKAKEKSIPAIAHSIFARVIEINP